MAAVVVVVVVAVMAVVAVAVVAEESCQESLQAYAHASQCDNSAFFLCSGICSSRVAVATANGSTMSSTVAAAARFSLATMARAPGRSAQARQAKNVQAVRARRVAASLWARRAPLGDASEEGGPLAVAACSPKLCATLDLNWADLRRVVPWLCRTNAISTDPV